MEALPDITSENNAEVPTNVQWVGMDDIAVPVLFKTQDGVVQQLHAKTCVYVSLDKAEAKGIHMSRLHVLVNELATMECNKQNLSRLLEDMVRSQQGISDNAKITLSFDLLLKKPALLSDESGYQSYSCNICAEKTSLGFTFEIAFTIPYSSTCPCSASLARQLYAQSIEQRFSESSIDKRELLEWIQSSSGSVATPHSQRSYAYFRLTLNDSEWPDLSQLIFELERVIGTPVQTAVKRVDEQEFARLNASNLMFCEDAARRLKSHLSLMPFLADFWCKVEHQESLHAHNAVAIIQK